MESLPVPSQPAPVAAHERQSTASAFSRLWRSHRRVDSAGRSAYGLSKTLVVPLFLSTARSSTPNNPFAQGTQPVPMRSPRSTRAVIDPGVAHTESFQPLAPPHGERDEVSDLYAGSVRSSGSRDGVQASVPLALNQDDPETPFARNLSYSARNRSRSGGRPPQASARRVRQHRRPLHDPQVSAKAKISFAFGVTLLVSLIVYLLLVVTGVARNTLFHITFILFILTLTGVFCHQLIRMLMLMQRRRRSPRTRSARHRRDGRAHAHDGRAGVPDDMTLDKPILIHMASDDGLRPDVEAAGGPTIQVPPPRINPDLVHWTPIAPTPLTPTYDEAVAQVHHTLGYRPPSYWSESGMTESMARRGQEVDAALEHIHPLERERMRTLAGEALEGRLPT